MKFGVVVGNIVSIFEYKDDYERFTYMMRSMSKIVKLMSPEEWVNNMSPLSVFVMFGIVNELFKESTFNRRPISEKHHLPSFFGE